jgi:hypothetical protein
MRVAPFGRTEAAMHLTLAPEENRLLIHHLVKRIEHMENELVHTDKRELQRSLAHEVDALRALTERLRAGAPNLEREVTPEV